MGTPPVIGILEPEGLGDNVNENRSRRPAPAVAFLAVVTHRQLHFPHTPEP